MKKRGLAAAILALSLLATGCSGDGAPLATQPPQTQSQDSGQLGAEGTLVTDGYLLQQRISPISPDVARVAKDVSPCVVGIQVVSTSEAGVRSGLGSGVFVDASGYVLTNYHVAGTAEDITAVLQDGSKVPARRVWGDRALDLAVIKCEGGPYPSASLGTIENLQVGEPVIAIGTPLDLAFQHTVTSGIVSAKDRTLQVPTEQGLSFMEELIQTDASINPGNSGGPLLNLSGQVIGINTVKVEQAEGIGFAIPIDICLPIVSSILSTGGFETPYIGLFVIDRDIARYYDKEVEQGLCALNVDANGPAAQAGIQAGDCILTVNGQEAKTVLQLRRLVYEAGVGGTVSFTYEREGKAHAGSCTLTTKPVA